MCPLLRPAIAATKPASCKPVVGAMVILPLSFLDGSRGASICRFRAHQRSTAAGCSRPRPASSPPPAAQPTPAQPHAPANPAPRTDRLQLGPKRRSRITDPGGHQALEPRLLSIRGAYREQNGLDSEIVKG